MNHVAKAIGLLCILASHVCAQDAKESRLLYELPGEPSALEDLSHETIPFAERTSDLPASVVSIFREELSENAEFSSDQQLYFQKDTFKVGRTTDGTRLGIGLNVFIQRPAREGLAATTIAPKKELDLNVVYPFPDFSHGIGFGHEYAGQLGQREVSALYFLRGNLLGNRLVLSGDVEAIKVAEEEISEEPVAFSNIYASGVVFSPSGNRFAVFENGTATIWSSQTAEVVARINEVGLPAVFSPDGSWLYATADENNLHGFLEGTNEPGYKLVLKHTHNARILALQPSYYLAIREVQNQRYQGKQVVAFTLEAAKIEEAFVNDVGLDFYSYDDEQEFVASVVANERGFLYPEETTAIIGIPGIKFMRRVPSPACLYQDLIALSQDLNHVWYQENGKVFIERLERGRGRPTVNSATPKVSNHPDPQTASLFSDPNAGFAPTETIVDPSADELMAPVPSTGSPLPDINVEAFLANAILDKGLLAKVTETVEHIRGTPSTPIESQVSQESGTKEEGDPFSDPPAPSSQVTEPTAVEAEKPTLLADASLSKTQELSKAASAGGALVTNPLGFIHISASEGAMLFIGTLFCGGLVVLARRFAFPVSFAIPLAGVLAVLGHTVFYGHMAYELTWILLACLAVLAVASFVHRDTLLERFEQTKELLSTREREFSSDNAESNLVVAEQVTQEPKPLLPKRLVTATEVPLKKVPEAAKEEVPLITKPETPQVVASHIPPVAVAPPVKSVPCDIAGNPLYLPRSDDGLTRSFSMNRIIGYEKRQPALGLKMFRSGTAFVLWLVKIAVIWFCIAMLAVAFPPLGVIAAGFYVLYGLSKLAPNRIALTIEPSRGRTLHSVEHAKANVAQRRPPHDPGILWGGVWLPTAEASQHFCLVGAPGSGKSWTIKLLMKDRFSRLMRGANMNAIVYDSKRDAYPVLRGIDPKLPVILLNPMDARSHAWDMAKDLSEPNRASAFASVLIPEQPESTPFFTNAARSLLSSVLQNFVRNRPGEWTLRDVLLVMSSRTRLLALLESDPYASDTVEQYFSAQGNQKEQGSIMSTISSHLDKYRAVAAAAEACRNADGSKRSISITEWKDSNAVLVIGRDREAQEAVDTLNQLFFQQLAKIMLNEPEQRDSSNPRQTWIFLDEVRDAQKLGAIQDLITQGRSKRIAVVLGFQDIEGMREVYGDHTANEIVNNCQHKGFLQMTSEPTARWASEQLGTLEYTDIRESQSIGKAGEQDTYSYSTERVTREIVTPTEIMAIPAFNKGTPLIGYYISRSAGAYKYAYPPQLLPKIFPLPSDDPDYVPRPSEEQVFHPFSEADHRRLFGTAIPTVLETKAKPVPFSPLPKEERSSSPLKNIKRSR